jgi:cytochrome c-type biogenesis protein
LEGISIIAAFAAGLLSIFSPCVLPMLPVYLASLSGPELFMEKRTLKLSAFFHSLSFVIGFSLVFIALGTLAGLTGTFINSHASVVRWISGGLMLFFGIFMLLSPWITWLNYEKRLNPSLSTTGGFLRSALLGMLFALAWTPCAGPILGGIFSLALSSSSVWQGTALLAIYSLGAAVPFLLLGLIFNSLQPWIKRIVRYSKYIYLVSGILLIGVGTLILLDKLTWFRF